MDLNQILTGPENIQVIARRDDLLEFASIYANKILESQSKPPVKKEIEQPISFIEAEEFLGKTRQTLTKWRKRGIIQGHTLGGRVYFLKSELLESLNKKSA